MKLLKNIMISLGFLVLILALFIGFVALCKWQNWLPDFTEKVVEFFNKIGFNFLSKIKNK